MPDIRKIMNFLCGYMKKTGKPRLTAVEANRLLAEADLLKDSPSKPGLPLRRLLRAGRIPNAYQDPPKKYGRWFIPHSKTKRW